MRRSSYSFTPAVLVVFVALATTTVAFAENAEFEGSATEGSQLEPAGAAPYTPKANNLNSVPEDTLTSRAGVTESPLVRQILTARPNEDLVICIAGCFSGRDRVVYAQPAARPALVLRGTEIGTGLSRSAAADTGTRVIINGAN